MPLSLEQYIERLGERTDLPWPSAPKIDPPKAKPHLTQLPIKAVMWTIYGTLVSIPQGELLFEHPQKMLMDIALDKAVSLPRDFLVRGASAETLGKPAPSPLP